MTHITAPSDGCPAAILHADGEALDAIDADALRALIEEHGAVIIRGAETSAAGFGAMAKQLCSTSVFNESPGRESYEGGMQSVNLGDDPFPLHPELSREPWRPDLAMFACLSPPGIGGQTTICDGAALVDALPDDLRETLDGRELIYLREAGPETLQYWLGSPDPDDAALENSPETCPYFFRRSGGRVIRGFRRPVFEPTLFGDRRAFGNFLFFARDYLRNERNPVLEDGSVFPADWLDTIRSTARRLSYAHAWQAGDVIMLDNSRFMHGRRAIVMADERRIATYFGYLKGIDRRALDPVDPPWRKTDFVPPEVPEAN
ncbi:TauD/TfdA family dioxygenase [Paraurantiacibacter namhicola]|uniref:Alpha-ketoglutarate-dependent 2,4-dichlorophenoxyacetate dioxygenase n=1 Tax=Paraurantiacibacter namhicola TaxID=645517 RepID=A0A1C7D8W1_9SPHN|nr:TauD/TfdA family dioxygenase [Paraurantiacibacter namhicola]ANU07914.1 Alpha-ketoglutarate-dependent 2,4-dichlorophenoxyacetate dioxygenase [Paraurantiacibacter namhicola]